jgi:hypothetical protein
MDAVLTDAKRNAILTDTKRDAVLAWVRSLAVVDPRTFDPTKVRSWKVRPLFVRPLVIRPLVVRSSFVRSLTVEPFVCMCIRINLCTQQLHFVFTDIELFKLQQIFVAKCSNVL